MKKTLFFSAALLALSLAVPPAMAQPNHGNNQHRNDRNTHSSGPAMQHPSRPGPTPGVRHNAPHRSGPSVNDNRRRANVSHLRRTYMAPKRYRAGQYRPPSGYHYRRWTSGQFLPGNYYARNYWLSSFATYGLIAPPSGYVWVRVGPDALMIDRYNGEVVRVAYNIFY